MSSAQKAWAKPWFPLLQRTFWNDLSILIRSSFDETDGFVVPENLPPLMSLSLQSRDVLELTVTKTLLGVLNTLSQSFTEISDQVSLFNAFLQWSITIIFVLVIVKNIFESFPICFRPGNKRETRPVLHSSSKILWASLSQSFWTTEVSSILFRYNFSLLVCSFGINISVNTKRGFKWWAYSFSAFFILDVAT